MSKHDGLFNLALRDLFCLFVFANVFGGSAAPATAAAEEQTTPAKASKPNIIWIVADDLGYNDLSCMGQENFETPNIDAMASGGMRFTQFYAGSTVCAPSRACFMTGQHTGHVYQRFNGSVEFREDPQDVTIATLLKNAGYKTAMIGKSGLSCNSNDKQLPNRKGFDHFFGFISHTAAHRYYPPQMIRNGAFVKYDNNHEKEGEVYSGDEFVKESLEWISQNKDSQFFLHMSLQQPHADLQVPDSYRQKFIGKFDETPSSDGHYRAEENPKATVAGMITYLDESIGKVVGKIKELGLAENTLIMFTSDNGPHFEGGHRPENFDSNGPLRGGKRDLYEGGIRVPLVAYWPGTIQSGQTSDLISAFWDFPDTACELAGIDGPAESDGISIAPTLLGRGEQKQHENLYWEFYERGGKQAVRQGDWKAVRLNLISDRNGPIELYNLANDLGEEKNIADSHPDIVAKMAKIMENEHTPSTIASFRPKRSGKKTNGRRIKSGKVLKKKNWTIVEVDSESGFNGKLVKNIIDNKPNTYWHTQWQADSPQHPHYFVIDLGKPRTITGFRILNRQDGNSNGNVKQFEFYVADTNEFNQPVHSGSLKSTADEQSVKIPSTKGRFVKFVSLKAFEGKPYASMAEFNLETN